MSARFLFTNFRVLTVALPRLGAVVAAVCALGALAGCNSEPDGKPTAGPPSALAYLANPANYTQGVAITPNTLSYRGATLRTVSVSPELPTGLLLDGTTGTISGTPVGMHARKEYIVTAVNGAGSSFVRLQLAINDVPPQMTYGGVTDLTYNVGVPIVAITPTLAGGATLDCVAEPPLPAGLALSAQCVLSGTPTEGSEKTTHLISAVNSGGASTLPFDIKVIDIPPALTFAGTPYTFFRGIALTPVTPANAGGKVTSCAADVALPPGITLGRDCTLSGTPSELAAMAVYALTGTNTGGSDAKPVPLEVKDQLPAIAITGSPFTGLKGAMLTPIAATSTGGIIDTCTVTPALPTGLAVSNSCRITGTPTQVKSGTYTMKASNSAGDGTATFDLNIKDHPPSITYAPSTFVFVRGSALPEIKPIASGGAITGCISSPLLPSGLALSSACVLTGTPSAAAAGANYVITATNTGGIASTSIRITVNEIPPVFSYTASPYTWNKGVPIAALTPSSTGGTITSCAVAPDLPAGLALSSTCVISGTPGAVSAATDYTVTATNAAGSSPATLRLTVTDSPPAPTYVGSPYRFTVDSAIATVTPANAGGAITACVPKSGPLPAGLNLSSSCVISGTPTALSPAADYVVTASNPGGSVDVTLNIEIVGAVPALSYAGSPYKFIHNQVAAITPVNTGGAVVSCTSNPAMPAGFVLSATCAINGSSALSIPATDYLITATNSGGSATFSVNFSVVEPPPVIAYDPTDHVFTKNVLIDPVTVTNTGGAIAGCTVLPALPPGLTLGADCGITGTPTAVRPPASYTIKASNAGGDSSFTVSVTVNDSLPALTYDDSPYVLPHNVPIAKITPTNAGGAVTSCAIDQALPAGLSLGTDCSLTGTPTVFSAAKLYTVTATNSAGSSFASFSLSSVDAPPTIAYGAASYVLTLRTAAGPIAAVLGGGPITNCTIDPALPAGMSFSAANCSIGGTPTVTSANTTYTVTATNTGGSDVTTVDLRVKNLPQILFHGLSALDGSWNGPIPASGNVWKVAQDGGDLVAVTQAGAANRDSAWASFAADGSKMTYASRRPLDGTFGGLPAAASNIWTANANGSGALYRTDNPAAWQADEPPVFSPDGSRIVYASMAALSGLPGDPANPCYNIWIMNADGTGKQALTRNTIAGYDSRSPVFSRDGAWIFFSSRTALSGADDDAATQSYNIWKVMPDGSNRTPLTTEDFPVRDNLEPVSSPVDDQLAFTSWGQVGGLDSASSNVFMLPYGGGAPTAVTANIAGGLDSRSPSYAPDGQMLVFVSKMDVNAAPAASFNVWTAMLGGPLTQTPLTANNGLAMDCASPQFSPDGTRIVFSGKLDIGVTPAQSSNIWVMNANGSSKVALTRNTSAGRDSLLAPRFVWYGE